MKWAKYLSSFCVTQYHVKKQQKKWQTPLSSDSVPRHLAPIISPGLSNPQR